MDINIDTSQGKKATVMFFQMRKGLRRMKVIIQKEENNEGKWELLSHG